MTIFGSDMSHYDAPLTVRDGLDFFTHKACEGHRFYRDTEYKAGMTAARNLGVPVLGAYFVQHPGTVADQVDYFVSVVNADTPWWRDVTWLWQVDAERFSYMSRAPNLSEINAFGDLLRSRTGARASSVIVYAPKWLYGDSLRGLKYELWASSYGANPAVPYRQAYPGDTSTRWAAYSGQVPALLQYGSRTIIAGQTTCDANAYRGTLAMLKTKLTGTISTTPIALEDDMDTRQAQILWNMGWLVQGLVEGDDPIVIPASAAYGVAGTSLPNKVAQAIRAAGDVVTLTDAQVQAVADRLVAAADNPLGDADKPAVVAAVKQALREGTA